MRNNLISLLVGIIILANFCHVNGGPILTDCIDCKDGIVIKSYLKIYLKVNAYWLKIEEKTKLLFGVLF